MEPKAVSILVSAAYSESKVRKAAIALREQLGQNPTFGLVFVTPDYVPHAEDFLETVRLHAHVSLIAGCSSHSLIGMCEESEGAPGFTLILFALPDCLAKPFLFNAAMIDEANGPEFWHSRTGLKPDDVKAWLVFADPFHCPVDSWLKEWNRAYPSVPTFGGLASGRPGEPETWLLYNEELVESGVAIALCGEIEVNAVVSQGCKPIGEPLTVTGAERNILLTLGSKPAYEVLNTVFQALTTKEKENARGHLFAGLAMNEYVEDFKRGDFLVRNIIGADPITGAVAINAKPRIGQTVQYQLRDAAAASEDLNLLLKRCKESKTTAPPFAALLCSCNGRGLGLFHSPNHDARTLSKYFPNLPVAGFFANGEIGPVGDTNFIHGYTASLALFSKPKRAAKKVK